MDASASAADSVSWRSITEMRPRLLRFFRGKSGSAAEAEDLTQEVLIRALTHFKSVDPADVNSYVFRIAVNCWRDRCRRLKVRGIVVPFNEALIDTLGAENTPECVLSREEELVQLARGLEQLPLRTRTVLILIKLEQMKIGAVAEALGISVSAVNKHLARGLAQLAELHARKGGL